MSLTHINKKNLPAMVNVGQKAVTHRTARARAILSMPPPVWRQFKKGDIRSKKGPVFQSAILAGVMAAKRTSEIIPLCHPLPLEDCQIEIRVNARKQVVIDCRCEIHHKTGVEMEALVGASTAALTIYDMVKALSHEVVIKEIRLVEKTGGKRDFRKK